MGAEAYTPTVEELVESHAFFAPGRSQDMEERREAARRAIAQVRAEAKEEGLSAFANDVLNERESHAEKGYDAEHDDEHAIRELLDFAEDYMHGRRGTDPRGNLAKATAMLIAAGESWDRRHRIEKEARNG